MYNQERKLAFLNQIQPADALAFQYRRLFGISEKTEKYHQRDLCELYSSSIRQVLSDASGTLQNSIDTIYFQLLRYVRWCQTQGYPVTEELEECKPDTADKIRTHMVASPSHLGITLNYIFPYPDEIQVQRIFRSFFWLAMAGFTDEEAISVTADQLDFRRERIAVVDRPSMYRPMYPRAIPDLRAAAELTSLRDLVSMHGGKEIFHPRLPGNTILRGRLHNAGVPSQDPLRTFLRPSVSRALAAARVRYKKDAPYISRLKHQPALNISYRSVLLSGQFYRAWRREKQGLPDGVPKKRLEDYWNWQVAFNYMLDEESATDG